MVRIVRCAPIAIAVLGAVLTLACQPSGAGDGDAGKPAPKLVCKVDNQCLICPDDAAMKKCIINPVTSGCKPAAAGDCP